MEKKVIYEVLRVVNGIPVFLENHLERMKNSFQLINEEFTLDYNKIRSLIYKLIEEENKYYGNIKITYGINEKILKVFFIEHFYPSDEMYKSGVDTILYFGERENPNAKIVNNNFREKVNKEIKDKDVYEAILVDKKGHITEGSKSNIFMVKDNKLMTSPTKAVLPGVTRGEVIKLAKKLGIEIQEVEYSYSDIGKLDGMFISGTSPKVLPVKKIDSINLDANNRIIRMLMDEYSKELDKYIKTYKN